MTQTVPGADTVTGPVLEHVDMWSTGRYGGLDHLLAHLHLLLLLLPPATGHHLCHGETAVREGQSCLWFKKVENKKGFDISNNLFEVKNAEKSTNHKKSSSTS